MDMHLSRLRCIYDLAWIHEAGHLVAIARHGLARPAVWIAASGEAVLRGVPLAPTPEAEADIAVAGAVAEGVLPDDLQRAARRFCRAARSGDPWAADLEVLRSRTGLQGRALLAVVEGAVARMREALTPEVVEAECRAILAERDARRKRLREAFGAMLDT